MSPQAELGQVSVVGKDFYLLTTLHFPHFIHYFITKDVEFNFQNLKSSFNSFSKAQLTKWYRIR